MAETRQPVRVLFCCTGVGVFNRGIESFFREAFDGLKDTPGLDAWLIKGRGKRTGREIPVWCLPRTGHAAKWLGKLLKRNSYIAEQLSSFLPVVRQIRRLRPQVIFYSDANLGFQLYFHRRRIGVPYRLLYSNGGPIPPPFIRTDFVHQVAPYYHTEALTFGEPAARHFMVPYGIRVPQPTPDDPAIKHDLRVRLQMPLNRPVVLSVGALNRHHKRMHYLIEEIARLPRPRPFLQMVGAMDEESAGVMKLADDLLGRDGYSARSVPYHEVFDFYCTADVFALASLREGFGRVYLEALMHGLPVIAHRHPVMEYVLGDEGVLGDLSLPGELAAMLSRQLQSAQKDEAPSRRREMVRRRFSWSELAPHYRQMFLEVSQNASRLNQ